MLSQGLHRAAERSPSRKLVIALRSTHFVRFCGLIELLVGLTMGEGGLKQAFVNLGRLAHQVLHGLPLLPGLFDQGFKRSAIVLRLSLQSLRRGLKQTSSKLKGLFLERKGIIYGRLVGLLSCLENLLGIMLGSPT